MSDLVKLVETCDRMLRGLPKIVSAAEETNEALEQGRLVAHAEIAAAGGPPVNMPAEIQAQVERAINEITDVGTQQARSLRALAKTQLALARGVRLLAQLNQQRETDMSAEDQFEALASDVSEKAAGIKCSAEDYQEGLSIIIDRLQTDLEASRETA